MSSEPMRPIADLAGQELAWIQPSGTNPVHELRAGQQLVGTLSFMRGTLASAAAAAGQWTFKREGFWHPQVTVRVPGDETNLAIFRPHAGGAGDLTFGNGDVFRLASTNTLQSEWVWQQQDQPLVRFKGRHGVVKASGTTEVGQAATDLSEVSLLVLLGWYLILLHWRDTVTATTGAIVAARVAVVR